jgi:hypothetical protein
VSQELDKARQQFADGKDRQAVRTLWVVESYARSDPNQARGLLDLASAIRSAADARRVTDDCDLLIGYARTALERLSRQADDPARGARRHRFAVAASWAGTGSPRALARLGSSSPRHLATTMSSTGSTSWPASCSAA